jgi:hypothetical protein
MSQLQTLIVQFLFCTLIIYTVIFYILRALQELPLQKLTIYIKRKMGQEKKNCKINFNFI